MVELGLLRAPRGRLRASRSTLDDVHAVAWRELDGTELTPGDIGLMLWIDARRGDGRGEELAERLDAALARRTAACRPGSAWSSAGSSPASRTTSPAAAASRPSGCSRAALDQLLGPNRADEPPVPPLRRRRLAPALPELRHPDLLGARADASWRATASTTGRSPRARACADRLIEHQLTTAACRGSTTPSAAPSSSATRSTPSTRTRWRRWRLLELWEVTGEQRYLDAVARGLRWIHGHNELGRRHGRPRQRARAALDPPPPRARPPVARRQDRRVARRPARCPARPRG